MSLDNVMQRLRASRKSSAPFQAHATGETAEIPSISVLSVLPPSDGAVAARFQVISSSPPSAQAISVSAAHLFNNEIKVVPGTVRTVNEEIGGIRTVECRLVRNVLKMPLTDDSTPEGFRSLSKNLFLEESSLRTWKLVDSNGSQVLVRDNEVETEEELFQMLSSAAPNTYKYSQDHRQMCSRSSAVAVSMERGLLVSSVDRGGKLSLGFVIKPLPDDKVMVLHNDEDAPGAISMSSIVDVYEAAGYIEQIKMPENETLSAAQRVDSDLSIDTIIDYYRQVLGFNQDFFSKWEDVLRSHGNQV